MYAAGIKLSDGNSILFDDDKGYNQPVVLETHTKNIEVGKVYDVESVSYTHLTLPTSDLV